MKLFKKLTLITFGLAAIAPCASFASQAPTAAHGTATAATGTALLKAKADNEDPAIVKVGARPVSVAFSHNGKFLAVTNLWSHTVDSFVIDSETGVCKPVPGSPFKTGRFPPSVAFSPDDRFTAMLSYIDNTGVVNVYAANQQTGAFAPITGSPFPISQPSASSITYRKDGNFALLNTSYGSLITYAVNKATGALNQIQVIPGTPVQQGSNYGSSIVSCSYSQSGNFAATVKLDDNCVKIYRVDGATGRLTQIDSFNVDEPIQMIYSPNDAFALVSDAKFTINVYAVNQKTGLFTLVPGSSLPLDNHPYHMAFSPDGNFLSVILHENNTVSVFAFDAKTGMLKAIQDSPFKTGKGPRKIAYHPQGDLAAVTNSDEDTISMYEVDRTTGAFTPLTGNMLQDTWAKRAMELMREALIDDNYLIADIAPILAAYIGVYMPARKPAACTIEEE